MEIDALARALAGSEADVLRLTLARRLVAAQIDVLRVRHARRNLIGSIVSNPCMLARIAKLERYERDALVQRRLAVREFGMAQPASADLRSLQSFLAFFQNEANE